MPKIVYVEKRFHAASLSIVRQANDIIAEYSESGFDLTLRQLYYQFVSRGLIANNDKEYKNLGSIISDARLAGLIDWNAISDRTRFLRANPHWDSPREIVESAAAQFRIDIRKSQPKYIEVWIEKDALIGVIERICHILDVPCVSCRGYVSQSTMWDAAHRRFGPAEGDGKDTIIFHLGDHDPSGIDMTRDIQERMGVFGSTVDVRRIALTMEQIEALKPPPNPAKLTDSRCRAYIAEYGSKSWELDALDPKYLEKLVEEHIGAETDYGLLSEETDQQTKYRLALTRIAKKLE